MPIESILTIPELIERYVKSLGKAGLVSIHGLQSLVSSILSAGDVSYFNISGLLDFIRRTDAENIVRHLGIGGEERLVFAGFQHLNPLESEFIFTLLKHAGGAAFLVGEDPRAPEQTLRIRGSVVALLERVKEFSTEHRLPAPAGEDFFTALSNAVFGSERLRRNLQDADEVVGIRGIE